MRLLQESDSGVALGAVLLSHHHNDSIGYREACDDQHLTQSEF